MLKSKLSAKEVCELGKKYVANTTLDSGFIPRRAFGSYIIGELASDGRERLFLDFCSSISVNNLGYQHPVMEREVEAQAGTGLHQFSGNDWYNEWEVLLAQKLCLMTPGSYEKKVFFSSSGTEAVEAAIKLCKARRYKEREKQKKVFCAFDGVFHGRTGFSLSLNCSKKTHTEAFFDDEGDLYTGFRIKDRAIPVRHLPFPEQGNKEVIDDFNASLNIFPWFNTSAVFLELVQGEGGIRVFDPESLNHFVKLCRENDVYVVVDEVQTGFLRTGMMFACHHFKLEPDIICLAKALGGGYQKVGATVFKKEFDFEKLGQHSNTFGGSPADCASSLAFIKELEKLDYSEALEKKIDLLASFAPEGLGFMRRIDFPTKEKRDKVKEKALQAGLLTLGAGEKAIRLMPPINISMKDLKFGIEILKKCI